MRAATVDPGSASPPSMRDQLSAVPRAVWAAVALMLVLAGASSVAVPLTHGPDEPGHYDLAAYLADGNGYPTWDGRRLGTGVQRWLLGYAGTSRRPHFLADQVPAEADRTNLYAQGGTSTLPGNGLNQIAQHPPLSYEVMAVALRVERTVAPGGPPPAVSTEFAFLRLLNALLVMSIPWAAYVAARRLGGGPSAGITAAFLCLSVPELAAIGGAINNDNLLTLLSSWLAVLVIGVGRGDLRPRTTVLVGVLEGLALLTKAFAFVYLPWIGLAYLLAFLRPPARRARAVAAFGSVLAIATALSGWFWIGNLVRSGTLTPTIEEDRFSAAQRPAGFRVDVPHFLGTFGAELPQRFWGAMGRFAATLPVVVVVLASLGLALVVTLGVARGDGSGEGHSHRVDRLLGLVPVGLMAGFVAVHSFQLYARSSRFAFIQGRYLFPVVVPLMALAGLGLARLVGRRAPLVALAAAVVMQGFGSWAMLGAFWGAASDPVGVKVHAMVAWSAYSTRWLGVLAAVGVTVAAIAAVTIGRDPQVRPRS